MNSFAQPNFQTDKFAQRNGPKMPITKISKILKKFANSAKIIKKKGFFSCFAQILKTIAQPNGLTTSTFRSSA